MSELQRELDQLIAKRDRIRERQMQTFHNGTHTRARTTTSNAQVDQLQERIQWLRDEIKATA